MASAFVLLLVLSVSSLLSLSSAQNILGFEITSSVQDYLTLSKDVCEIIDLMTDAPYDFPKAKEIYEKGKASGKTLKGEAVKARTGEPLWEKYKNFFGSATWIDTFVSEALDGTGKFATINEDGRSEAVKKGIQSNLLFYYSFHELDVAANLIASRKSEDNQNEGAQHNVDEAFAIYVGESPGCTLYGVAERRANEYGTRGVCGSPGNVNTEMVRQFQAMKTAAKNNDATVFNTAYTEAIRQQYIVYVQATIKYAVEVSKRLRAGSAADSLKGDQVEGYAFYRTIAPLVSEANATAHTAIEAAFNIQALPKDTLEPTVIAALNSTFAAMKIKPEEVGGYMTGKTFDCPTNTLPATSVSLKSTPTSAASCVSCSIWAVLVAVFVLACTLAQL